MNTQESPFRDLDLFCDWTGELADPVLVRLCLEVRAAHGLPQHALNALNGLLIWQKHYDQAECGPLFESVVLDARSSHFVGIDDFSIEPSKPTLGSVLIDDTLVPLDDHSLHENASIVDPCSFTPEATHRTIDGIQSPKHSVSEFNDNGSEKPAVTDIVLRHLFGDSVPSENISDLTLPDSPNSRKRSARAASLPDSVTDSERYSNSFSRGIRQHKSVYSASGCPTPPQARVTPSRIPRPVSVHLPTNVLPDLIKTPSSDKENVQPPKLSMILSKRQATWMREAVKKDPSDRIDIASVTASRGNSWEDGNSRCPSSNSGDRIFCEPQLTPPYREIPSVAPVDKPFLYMHDSVFHIRCSAGVPSGKYKVTISFYLRLANGSTRGWRELVVPGLPRLHNDDCGYLYFWTPPSQGMEFRTSQLKRYTVSESCLMGQFDITPTIAIPLRPCDGKFYGWLKDFQVKQSIRSDIIIIDPETGTDLVKYYAICSINLVQRDFWAEECGLTLFIDGGPEGAFSGHLGEPLDKFQLINLEAPNPRVGVSELQLTCCPSNLGMFVVSWEIRMPHKRFSSWVPRISGTRDPDVLLQELQDDFVDAEERESLQIVQLMPSISHFGRRESVQMKQSPTLLQMAWNFRHLLLLCPFLTVITAGLYLASQSISCACTFSLTGSGFEATLPAIDPPEIVEEYSAPAVEGGVVLVTSAVSAHLPLRDRFDYLLGWRGPIHQE
ncbi:hypothetical protein N7468_008570 [Penicillium chermesinum]|uniref:Uncharacterized protein n=1 Tax=Penicillium chermesinum TaxID=63820 RepID=A0A9W9TIK9_9EURO|nr:uncharacterized protein N7468_008570 [Penicillium chermesinum]KAJ5224028.1 hypothetical protein N7468_008570 [Penicillium chermesinum]KAJ6155155.1 hypothetical protein N7470_005721 [Penicillium chermesinum]